MRCASKSFATPQSCFISIKVVAVGQQTGTNVDCINTDFVGFLALVGFAAASRPIETTRSMLTLAIDSVRTKGIPSTQRE
jgi:hypothetical protein